MPRKGDREYVSFKSVRLALYPYGDRWRVSYPDESVKGGWAYLTRATKALAKEAGHAKAVEIANGLLNLSRLSQEEARLARAFLDLKPTWATIERLRREGEIEKISIKSAIEKFYQFKVSETGIETKHLKITKADLLRLASYVGEDTPLIEIDKIHLSEWLGSMNVKPKRKRDYRGAAVSLWRWASKQGVIEVRGSFTEPEKVPSPKLIQKEIRFFSPDEMRFLLENVSDNYRTWLALACFSGLRTGEIRGYRKRPLDWSMIKEDEGVIIVPADISKNRKRKIVPIHEPLASWLALDKNKVGPVIPRPASEAETLRLGKLMDRHFEREEGWPGNAPRHSYATYRVAVCESLAEVSHEMDNSETMLKRHYVEAASKHDAQSYFSLSPSDVYRTKYEEGL